MIKDDCGGVWLDWPRVITLFDDDGNERDYIPGRTCKRELVELDESWCCYKCDECGYPIDNDDRYCSGCGAKVVKE